jgi:hypothetical protein
MVTKFLKNKIDPTAQTGHWNGLMTALMLAVSSGAGISKAKWSYVQGNVKSTMVLR